MRITLNREAGERPALSRSCNVESTSIRHWETGKARETRKQSQKNCPIGTLYRPCERQEGTIIFICIFYAFLPESKKVFYLHGVCTSLCAIFRSCHDAAIMLAFWKQNVSVGLCRARTLFLWCMDVYGLCLLKGEIVNEKEDS